MVITYCSLFQEMKLVHKPAEKMLPNALFLCFAVLTVHSENSNIPSTLHKIYLHKIILQLYDFTTRFEIGSVNFRFNASLQGDHVG